MSGLITDEKICRNIIMSSRKGDAIGCYITERLFANSFLYGYDNIEISTGWYFSSVLKQDRQIIFLYKEKLSNLDRIIAETIKGMEVWQILVTEEAEKIIRLNGDTKGTVYTISEYIKKYSLSERISNSLQTQEEDIIRRKRYCDYLQKESMLVEVANTINVENRFLNRYFYSSNLEFFYQE